MGAVSLPFNIVGIHEWIKFYIIDAKMTYNALIGRPWLHKNNNVVPSTLQQCLKYVKIGEVKQINGEMKPFEVHEIGLRDAKNFLNKPSQKSKNAKSQQKVKSVLYETDTDSSSGEETNESIILSSNTNPSDESFPFQYGASINNEVSCNTIHKRPNGPNPNSSLNCNCSECQHWEDANQMFICNEWGNAYHPTCLYPGETVEHQDRRYFGWMCATCLSKRDPPRQKPKRERPDNDGNSKRPSKVTHETYHMVSIEPSEE